MMVAQILDNRLARALCEGAEVLPDDLAQLAQYLRLIDGLLAEKAMEHEAALAQVDESAAEIECLQVLEATVAERAISNRAGGLEEILAKLEIWRALAAGAEPSGEHGDRGSQRDRLVLSVEADIVKLARGVSA
jgi:hypothetical protein